MAGKRIVIVGGSFLGSELACALAKYGKQFGSKVTQVFSEEGIFYFSRFLFLTFSEYGICVSQVFG